MTLTQAIKTARDRVRVTPWGRGQWSVNEWSPRHNATIQGQMTDRWRAVSQAKEARIRVALELLEVEDAGAVANGLAYEEGGWEDLLRSWYRKYPTQPGQ